VFALIQSPVARVKISIVIPAFNEEKLLPATLCAVQDAAAAFVERGWATELLVCDNNSTDRTAEVARAGGAIVVFEPVNQISRARNAGAAAATGEWLVFVDADSQPARELFAEVARAMDSGRYVAGGATVRVDEPALALSFITGLWNVASRLRKWCAGSFIFCETRAFRAIGGFSTELFASEELDLSQRLKAFGRKEGRGMIILHRHPLVTSARKAHLYSHREHLRLLWRIFWTQGRAVKNREACHIWYDGRR
jgi:glycosyltransferase involved in cell wall biosynthesis